MMDNTINGRTPEEIKKGLEHCAAEGSSCKDCVFCADCDVDIYAIERYALAYIQQLEPAQPKWISVEERLPEKSGRYLINLGNGWVEECWFDHLEERWEEEHGDYSEDVTESVTHWMPLPEPPKEET